MADDTAGEDTVQEKFAVCSFTVEGTRIAFAIISDEMQGGNRIVEHKRPYRQGAKLDSTGSEPDIFSFRAIFNNSIDEPGITQNPPLYPDVMQELIRIFKKQATGDLMSPIDGLKRVRAKSWKRVQPVEETDTAYLDLVFEEDNEDNVDAESFQQPGVQGSVIRLSELTVFSAEQAGLWNENLISVQELASELEGLIRFPGEYANAIVAQQRSLQTAIRSVIATARQEDASNRALLEDTPVRAIFRLIRMVDVVSYALSEKQVNLPQTVPWIVRTTTNIAELARDVRQPQEVLLDLNAQRIDDPFNIDPGIYRVYRTWP